MLGHGWLSTMIGDRWRRVSARAIMVGVKVIGVRVRIRVRVRARGRVRIGLGSVLGLG